MIRKRLKLILLSILVFLLIISCLSSPTDESSDISYPQWMLKMPVDTEYYWGIGSHGELDKAKQMAIVDVGQQFSTHISSVLEERVVDNSTTVEHTVVKLDSLLTDQVVTSSKFVEQFTDLEGMHWILARAPLDCILDVSEKMILSYQAEIKQPEQEVLSIVGELGNRMSNPEARKEEWTEVDSKGRVRLSVMDYNSFRNDVILWDFNESTEGWKTTGGERVSQERFNGHNVLKVALTSGYVTEIKSQKFSDIDFSDKSIEIRFFVYENWQAQDDDKIQFTAFDEQGTWRGSEGPANGINIKAEDWSVVRYNYNPETRGDGDINKVVQIGMEFVEVNKLENKVIYFDYIRILKR